MKKKLCIVMMIVTFLNLHAASYRIEQIESFDLSNESKVFSAFRGFFAQESSDIAEKSFEQEEQDYHKKLEKRFFFHALFDDQVIGYISCDFISMRDIVICQWAIEPSIFDETLVKDLLCAVLSKVSKIKTLRINCPACSQELISFFQNLGFVLLGYSDDSMSIVFEFKANSKCKLCDLLYGNIWDREDDQDDSEDDIVVHSTDLVIPDVDYN